MSNFEFSFRLINKGDTDKLCQFISQELPGVKLLDEKTCRFSWSGRKSLLDELPQKVSRAGYIHSMFTVIEK